MVMSEESVPLHACIRKQHTQHHCRYLKMQTYRHKKLISSEHTSRQTGLVSLSISLLFSSLFGPFQCCVGNEFENCPISFALSEMSLSTGERGYHAMVIYFSVTNKVINIFFFPVELVTRLSGVSSRSHTLLCAAWMFDQKQRYVPLCCRLHNCCSVLFFLELCMSLSLVLIY